jgi:hypothetical protein
MLQLLNGTLDLNGRINLNSGGSIFCQWYKSIISGNAANNIPGNKSVTNGGLVLLSICFNITIKVFYPKGWNFGTGSIGTINGTLQI